MPCACPGCPCQVDPAHRFEWRGKVFCSETCARQCTEEKCVCAPCDCSKVD